MSLNDLIHGDRDGNVDVKDNLDTAVRYLHKIGREIEHLSVTAVGVVESLDDNEHELHWSEVDAAEMVWENLDEMVERHKEAVQLVDNARRELEQ